MPRTLNNEVDIQNVAGLDNDIRDSFTRAMLSEDENVTGVAARDYDINEFFIHSDRYLYKALTAITQGDTIVPGTNAQKFTVSKALYELYAQSADSIRDLLSNVEEGANASRNFVAGEEIIWTDGFLYKVLTTVTSGTAWAATGANPNIVLAANLTSQIQALANSLSTETTNRENADSAIVKNGAMNLAPNDATTQVVSGVTFSIDKTNSATNGIITLSGTASEAITLVLGKFKVPIGSYVLSSKADGSKARVTVEAYNGSTWKSLLASTASSDDVSFNVDYSNYDTLWISVRIDSGTNVNGVVVKPMVSVIAGEYVPYAKTNRQLTEDLDYAETFVAIPSTYHTSASANIRFMKRGNVVTCEWTGGGPKIPAAGTNYDIVDIPDGFKPQPGYTHIVQAIDLNTRTKAMYFGVNIGSRGKISICGYGTGTNDGLNCTPLITYIL